RMAQAYGISQYGRSPDARLLASIRYRGQGRKLETTSIPAMLRWHFVVLPTERLLRVRLLMSHQARRCLLRHWPKRFTRTWGWMHLLRSTTALAKGSQQGGAQTSRS